MERSNNKKLVRILFFLLIVALFSSAVSGVIWSPQDNISLKNRHYITNDPIDACGSDEVVVGKNDSGMWNCTSFSSIDTNETTRVEALEAANVTTNLRVDNLNDTTYKKLEIEAFNNTLYSIIQIEFFNNTLYRFSQIEAMNDTMYRSDQVEGMNDSIRANVEGMNDTIYKKIEIEAFNDTLYKIIQIEMFNNTLYRFSQIEAMNDTLYRSTQIEAMNDSIRANVEGLNDTLYKINQIEGMNDTIYKITQIEGFNDSLYGIFYNKSEVEGLNDTLYKIVQIEGMNDTLYLITQIEGLNDTLYRINQIEGLNDSTNSRITILNASKINLTDQFGGDVTGTYDVLLVKDESHLHKAENVTDFNETVEAITASVTYNATSILTTEGTNDSGNLSSIQVINVDSYNVSELSGGSPLLVEINFTGVQTFSNILFRLQYVGGLGHEIAIETWNYDDSSWENHGEITDQSTMTEFVIDILDAADHVSGGIVQLRLDHQQNGNAAHRLYIDYVALQQGFTSITAADHDSLLGRDDTNNHPWALDRAGAKALTADWPAGQQNITAIITAFVNSSYFWWNGTYLDWLFGDIYSQSQIEAMNNTLWSNISVLESALDTNETTRVNELIVANVSTNLRIDDLNDTTYKKTEIEEMNNTMYRSLQIEGFNSTLYKINQIEAFNNTLYRITQIEGMNDSLWTNVSQLEVNVWDNLTNMTFTDTFFPDTNDSLRVNDLFTMIDNLETNFTAENTSVWNNLSTMTFSDTNAKTICNDDELLRGQDSDTCSSIDASGACGATNICAGGHTHPASQVTAGSFGTGDYVFDTNVTTEGIVFEKDTTNHKIYDNATCIIIEGDNSKLIIC